MKTIIAITVLGFLSLSAFAQSSFQNLDFSAANLPPFGSANFSTVVPTSSGIPGWAVYYGTVQQNNIYYDDAFAPTPSVMMSGGSGDFAVQFLTGSFSPSVSISQTGTVPGNAQYLLFGLAVNPSYFNASTQPLAQIIGVTLGNQNILLMAVSTGSGLVAEGSIPASLDGQTEQLSIYSSASGTYPGIDISNVEFSPTAITVPEPPPQMLIAMGGLLFACFRRWKSNLRFRQRVF